MGVPAHHPPYAHLWGLLCTSFVLNICNVNRVALLTTSFHECLIGGAPAGPAHLAKRLLEDKGFHVLVVNFETFSAPKKKLDNVKVLDKMLNDLLLGTK